VVKLKISGMTCKHCASAITHALKGVAGVQKAEVNLELGLAEVEGSAKPETLVAAVTEEGYHAEEMM